MDNNRKNQETTTSFGEVMKNAGVQYRLSPTNSWFGCNGTDAVQTGSIQRLLHLYLLQQKKERNQDSQIQFKISASKNDAGIIADVLLCYTTPSFEALTNYCLLTILNRILNLFLQKR